MPKQHALLSASGAAKWLNCPPSARLEEKFPNVSSEYAREGTTAHALAEITTRYWLGEITAEEFENQKQDLLATEDGEKFYTPAMQEHADDYSALIGERLAELKVICDDAFVELEVKVNFSRWVPSGFGTADCIIVSDDRLEVIDFKYGKGHRVDAVDNPQMKLYALGALEYFGTLYDIKTIRMTIFQPRISGEPSSDEITVKDLMTWANKTVKPKAKQAFNGIGDFNPSETACKFCRAKGTCKARYEKNLSLFNDSEDPLLITPEEASEVLKKAKDIKTWLEDLTDSVQTALLKGTKIPGWKIVEGRSNRKYVDEDKVAAAMKKAGYAENTFYEKKLLSITKMEDTFGKKKVGTILKDLIIKPAGAPTLAPESDKRPEYKPEDEILKAFDDVEE